MGIRSQKPYVLLFDIYDAHTTAEMLFDRLNCLLLQPCNLNLNQMLANSSGPK